MNNNEYVKLNKEIIKNVVLPLYLKIDTELVEVLDIEKNKNFINNFINNQDDSIFYVKKRDLQLLIRDYSEKLKRTSDLKERTKIIASSGQMMFQNIISQNFSDESIENGFSLVLETVNGDKEVLTESLRVLLSEKDVGSTTLLRSIFCYMIAQSLDWKMNKNYQNLVISSILADIGNILNQAKPHPLNSLPYLGKFAQNNDIHQIVLHHHENLDGSGPLGLTKFKIHPLAKILRSADELTNVCRMTKTLPEALYVCLNYKKNVFDKDPLEKLFVHLKTFLKLKI